MDPSNTYLTTLYWYYMADCGAWHRIEDNPLNPISSETLELHYLRYQYQFDRNLFTSIDFAAMTMMDVNTGKERRILRSPLVSKSCSCFSTGPDFWENVNHKYPYQLIPLNKQSNEYQTVENYTKKDGLLSQDILSIKRIQNLDLWEFYCRKKIQLLKIHRLENIEERRLFHGTTTENVDTICKFNFDPTFAGRHGHAYGKGVYFAKHASYANTYSKNGMLPDSLWGFPTKVMFLAKVIVGKSKAGESDFLKPDHGSAENIHQSSVDDTKNPKIFVIFDSNQIYPEYLIEYL